MFILLWVIATTMSGVITATIAIFRPKSEFNVLHHIAAGDWENHDGGCTKNNTAMAYAAM